MIRKKGLSKEELKNITAGEDEIPAPPPGYKFCDNWLTCPRFNWRVCIFPVNDIGPGEVASKSCF